MSTELEKRLEEYEKNVPITNDRELTEALENIIEEEEKLPYTQRNFELIGEAVDTILTLSGEDTLELEAYAQEVSEKHLNAVRAENSCRPRGKFILKHLVPIAALISLVIVGSLVAFAGNHTDTHGSFVNLESRFDGNADINSSGEYYEYYSLEEFCALPKYEFMVKPKAVPDGYTIDGIFVQSSCLEVERGYFVDYFILDVFMESEDDRIEVTVEYPAFTMETSGVELTINGNNVYCCAENGRFRGNFMLNGQSVSVIAPTFRTLKAVISSIS